VIFLDRGTERDRRKRKREEEEEEEEDQEGQLECMGQVKE